MSDARASDAAVPAAVRPRTAPGAAGVLSLALFVVVLTLLVPLILLLRLSLDRLAMTDMVAAALKPPNYLGLVANPFYRTALHRALDVAAASTAVCLVVGLPIAYRLARMRRNWKSVCMLPVLLPLMAGGAARMAGWLSLFAHGGMPANHSGVFGPGWIEIMFSPTTLAASVIAVDLPCVILLLQSAVEAIDPRLEQAAQSLGAAPGRAFRRIVWPLTRGWVLLAGLLSALLAFDACAVPFLLGGPQFQMAAPLLPYWQASTDTVSPFAWAMALLLMLVTLALVLLANLLAQRRRG